jgi:Helix-turn-helix domain
MEMTLRYDPDSYQLTGSAGSLELHPDDKLAQQFLMLIEGHCQGNVSAAAQKYGYCRERYYQLRRTFYAGGLAALLPKKTGPKTKHRRTDEVVRQVLRYFFLDPDTTVQVVTQKLRQTHFPISLRSVQRIAADWGLQKKSSMPTTPRGESLQLS